ncbi:MAG: carboxypeptidase regulatory-like domain-containing protein [Muribaculaceae bacterium]|nr:carboxypeptidase regulatory-like domain-containing protein [Muribaculaceae bacterium]
MNRKSYITLLFSTLAVASLSLPAILGATPGDMADLSLVRKPLKEIKVPVNSGKSKSRVKAKEDYFFEDFESMQPGKLNDGWKTSFTPGHPSDVWSVATLGSGDDPIQGVSGTQYAYILGNRDSSDPYGHDAWLFSPAIRLKSGMEYDVEFYSYLAPGYNVNEVLEVWIMSSPSSGSKIMKLGNVDDNEAQWKYNSYKWTPEEEGEYYIGFHSLSPFMGNATMIDDVCVKTGSVAGFYGAAGVDFGETDLVGAPYVLPYYIQNKGDEELEVDVLSSSPEVKVLGTPVKISPYGGFEQITIEFTPECLGKYKGEFRLRTSDPAHPEVSLLVLSDVKDVPIRDFHVEDFEDGGPKGWKLGTGAVNTDFKGGHDGPRSFYLRSFYTMDSESEVGFTTHYCNMGDNPEFSFWYKMIDCDLMGEEKGPTGSESPIVSIFISDDLGKNWKQVYDITPGTDRAHKPSKDFQEVRLSLPEYAGKMCVAKVILRHAGNPLTDDFMFVADDVALGTRPSTDLKVTSLHGSSKAAIGEKQIAKGSVRNLGSASSGNYTLELRDEAGKVYDSVECVSLEAGKSVEFTMEWIPENNGIHTLSVTAVTSDDHLLSNNTSNVLHVSVEKPAISGVEIGKGKQYLSNAIPINFCNRETMVQTIYYANELGIDAGEISSVELCSVFDYPHLTEEFEIYIAETDKSEFGEKDMIPESDFVKVFSGRVFMPSDLYTFTIPFDNPYDYRGGNLVIMTKKSSGEFLNTKRFLVYKGEGNRSVIATSFEQGALAANGYEGLESSSVYAHISINLEKAPHGSLSGVVKNEEGDPLSGVKVSLDGTQLSTLTASDGGFKLPEVKVGERSLSASRYGYYPSEMNPFEIKEGDETEKEIILTSYPRVALRGVVRTAEGDPIPGSKIVLDGYADYSAVTDEEGRYEITGIYGDTGEFYNLRAEALHFQTSWNHDYEILKSDVVCDFILDADVQPPFNVRASLEGEDMNIEWDAPLVEFKHDNGDPETYLGWPHGHAGTAVFSVYHQKMDVKKIRFYLSDCSGPHANINVFLVGLNSEGFPDASKMYYMAQNIPFIDNAWTTHVLDHTVSLENFAVGISGAGYMGLGASASDADHPFEPLMHFWAGDDMYNPYDLMDFSIWTPIHPMLRVYGDYLGDVEKDPLHESLSVRKTKRPSMTYNVYRIKESDSSEPREFLGSTISNSFKDSGFNKLKEGEKCRYSVEADYGEVVSDEEISNMVTRSGAGIGNVSVTDIAVGPNPLHDILKVNNPELVGEIRFFNVDGICRKTFHSISYENNIEDLPAGFYIVKILLNDGSSFNRKLIKE